METYEDTMVQMHKDAKKPLEDEKTLKTESVKKIARNIFKHTYWGIEHEEALKIGGKLKGE